MITVHTNTLHQKRDQSRRMNTCTGAHAGWLFIVSACATYSNSRAYEIWCEPPNTVFSGLPDTLHYGYSTIIKGQCHPHETCINSNPPTEGLGADYGIGNAFCVSMQNFVNIAQRELGSMGVIDVSLRNNAVEARSSSSTLAAAAILTGETDSTPLVAKAISISAFGEWPARDSVLNDTALCANCSSVVLDPVPVDAQKLRAGAFLELGAQGKLWLTILSM